MMPIARHLQDADIDLYFEGREKNLFLTFMPHSVRRGVLLRADQAGTPIDHELVGLYRTEFQLIVRHDDPVKGDELAKAASRALTVVETTVGGSMYALYIRPRHLPIVYPVSDGGLLEFAVNFDTCFRSI
jgi:hypothetical protein